MKKLRRGIRIKGHRIPWRVFMVLVLGMGIGVLAFQYQRPIPTVAVVPSEALNASRAEEIAQIEWPQQGSAAVALLGVGEIGETKNQKPQAIASLAKVMTAHLILQEHPLAPGQAGPEIELNAGDVQNYDARRRNGESVVAVTAGAKLTQRDLLRGLLIASANNFADVLATWHAGSPEAFVDLMNQEAKRLGMTGTHYADPSGLDAATVSTASDQVKLALAAMSNEMFARLVSEVQASIPGVGVIYNTNSQLGQAGIAGVKTGWTEEAGACFLFAARYQVEGRETVIVGSVLGQDTLADAFRLSRGLIPAAGSTVSLTKLVAKGEPVGLISTRWGATGTVVLDDDLDVLLVPGTQVNASMTTVPESSVDAGSEVGRLTLAAGGQALDLPLKASGEVPGPDLKWRLTRIR